jgi:hypothetical protein
VIKKSHTTLPESQTCQKKMENSEHIHVPEELYSLP